MEFIPLVMESYLWVPRLSVTVEIHGRAINELIRVLMSFIISVCLLTEKAIELDMVTLSFIFNYRYHVVNDKVMTHCHIKLT